MKFPLCLLGLVIFVGCCSCERQCPPDWDPKPCRCLVVTAEVYVFCKDIEKDDLTAVFSTLSIPWAFDSFYLFNSFVQSLPAEVFGKASFRKFKISENQLTTVDKDAFKGSEDTAEFIFFESNHLSNFDYSSLHSLRKLDTFMVTDDKHFSSVPDDAFGDNPNLLFITLKNNKIQSIGKRAFSKLPRLLSLDLEQNEINYFDADSLSIPVPVLSTKPIRPIRTLVYLANNKISHQSFHKTSLSNFSPERLDLSGNQLTTLPKEIFEEVLNFLSKNYPNPVGFIGKLDVTGNPFFCDQSTSWLSEYKSNIDGFVCEDGKTLQDLTL